MIKNRFFVGLLLSFFMGIGLANAQIKGMHPKNEFRAVWIATVVNIDWPKSGTDSVEKQKADFIEILDTYKKLNYNAIIVQIRSVGDAFYPSELAPWSRYLTGKEGQAPKPYYDTLEWMITQTHARGFEFHAWFNPYRATFDLKTETLSPNHDYFKHPEWMIKYGEKYYYNPALPEVQSHLTKIVEEVVQKYDIDAVHFDDYFYPYKIAGQQFNDSLAYKKYGNGLSIEDFRRANVNTFLKNMYITIKKNKPWVQFGISPFGVWRNKSVDPKGSDTQSGQTNYDDLFADPMAWMDGNYVDYMLPQLYWSINHRTASFAKLLKWWSENTSNTALYLGSGIYKVKADSDKRWNNPREIPNQINLSRSYSNVQGNAFYSAKAFVNKNKEVTDLLMEHQYKYPALPLPVPNAKKVVADAPKIKTILKFTDYYSFVFENPLNTQVRYVVVYCAKNSEKIDINDPCQITDKIMVSKENDGISIKMALEKLDQTKAYAFTFIDYYGNESTATPIDLN